MLGGKKREPKLGGGDGAVPSLYELLPLEKREQETYDVEDHWAQVEGEGQQQVDWAEVEAEQQQQQQQQLVEEAEEEETLQRQA